MSSTWDESELRATVERLVEERFGTGAQTFDSDETLTEMLVYHDVRQVLARPDLVDRLRDAISAAARGHDATPSLSGLHHDVEGLRMLLLAASAESTEEAVAELVHRSLLADEDASRLREVADLYSTALERAAGRDALASIGTGDDALSSVTEDVIAAYLDDLHASRRWVEPADALFSTDHVRQFLDRNDLSILLPRTWVELFRDEGHYERTIDRYERMREPFLADVARCFLFYGRVLHSELALDDYVRSAAAEVRELVERVGGYPPDEWAVFGDLRELAIGVVGYLRLVLGILESLPLDERLTHLREAEHAFARCDDLFFKAQAPMVMWLRSELLEGPEREVLTREAVASVNQLMAASALESDTVTRLANLTNLMLLPAGWKYARGDFAGAIETAAMARAMADVLHETCRSEMQPVFEEMERDIASPDLPAERREQVSTVREALLRMLEGVSAVVLAVDLITLSSRARLAEASNEFTRASHLYRQASQLEQDAVSQLISALTIFVDMAVASARIAQPGREHEARATYFNAMAVLNEADRLCLEGEYVEAGRHYEAARVRFERAAELWQVQLETRFSMLSGAQSAQQQAHSGLLTSRARMRYCDARVEMATAERFANVLGQPSKASMHFDRAVLIVGELLAGATNSGRDVVLLRASQQFCKGRALFEMDCASRRRDNVEEGREQLEAAAWMLEEIGESRWAHYARGLRFEYEAIIARQAAIGADVDTAARTRQITERAVGEAVRELRHAGLESRARRIESWGRRQASAADYELSMSTLVLPKPSDVLPAPTGSFREFADQLPQYRERPMADLTTIVELNTLQARATSLTHELSALETLRRSGRIQPETYAERVRWLAEQRAGVLQSLRAAVSGRDADLDDLIQAAVTDEQEASLMDRLADLGRRRSWPEATVSGLRGHRGSVAGWLVEIALMVVQRGSGGGAASPEPSNRQGVDHDMTEMDGLLARSIALDRQLADLKERRARGRVPDGQYVDLAADLDRERIEILMQIRRSVASRDADLDAIIRDAIAGGEEQALMDRLAQVADRKGLGTRFVQQLNQHRGTLISWLVEVGFEIARRGAQG